MKKLLIISLCFICAFWLVPSVYTLTFFINYEETLTYIVWNQYLAQVVRVIIALVQYPEIYGTYIVFVISSILALVFLVLTLVFFKKKNIGSLLYGATLLLTLASLITGTLQLAWTSMSMWGILENMIPHLLYVTSIILFIVYLLHNHPRRRRPSKVQQLEARIAELEKQVSEQENKE